MLGGLNPSDGQQCNNNSRWPGYQGRPATDKLIWLGISLAVRMRTGCKQHVRWRHHPKDY